MSPYLGIHTKSDRFQPINWSNINILNETNFIFGGKIPELFEAYIKNRNNKLSAKCDFTHIQKIGGWGGGRINLINTYYSLRFQNRYSSIDIYSFVTRSISITFVIVFCYD